MSPVAKARSTGFTLIELLVTIFIIGTLVAATLTLVVKVRHKVSEAQTQAELSAISGAIQQYYGEYRAYPGPLPNNQLCAGYDLGNSNSVFPSAEPFAPLSSTTNQLLNVITPNPFASGVDTDYYPANLQIDCITGAQNLVLGLLGGLEMKLDPTSSTPKYYFYYDPTDLFAAIDGRTPTPKGPASLNVTNPRRSQPYMNIKAGDISVPRASYTATQETNGTPVTNSKYTTGSGASFAYNDAPSLAAQDAMIPVFLDKDSSPMPILYYRTNQGGAAIVGFRNQTTATGGTGLQDPALASSSGNAANEIAQYDLFQNLPYTSSAMGVKANNPTSYHGLTGITGGANVSTQYLLSQDPSTVTDPSTAVDPIDYSASGQYVPTNKGANGLAYFKDPTLNTSTYTSPSSQSPANWHLGVARQKDSYILISAGPDRTYGTRDDIVFPGPLLP